MAKRSTEKPAQAIITAVLPELVPTQADGITLIDFFNGLVRFSQEAMALELRAKATLDAARALTVPTSKDEDEAIQTFIRRAAADEKQVDGHWVITKIVSAFHKRMTGARGRALTPLAEAKDIAQRLHNRYADAERRRVEEEAAANRKREEEAAAEARRKELEQLEAAALKAESSSPDLSERERAFVDAIVDGFEQATAATMAKYRNPHAQATRLMATPKIQKAIAAARAAKELRQQQEALAEKPLEVAETAPVESQIGAAGSDRTRYGAEVFDLAKWREGIRSGAIPIDTAVPHEPTLNDYGRKLREQIDRWPGVRHTKKTRTV